MRSAFFAILTLLLASNPATATITPDFQTWLSNNGYSGDNFARAELGTWGSTGGKISPNQAISHQPVIFIHGNSDCALLSNRGPYATGWTNSVRYFSNQGYSSAELYATTWGDVNSANAASRTHDCATVQRLRRFVEAVLAYTKAPKVDIISHSMGVTLGRKVVKGGSIHAKDGTCNIGSSLASQVDTFLGLAGGNYGLCVCEGTSAVLEATCNKDNGYWPGDECGFNYLDCGLAPLPFPCSGVTYSSYLTELNGDPTKEGDFVFSAWSFADDVILFGDNVWDQKTSLIPKSNGHKEYTDKTHMETKETTAADQYNAVVNHHL
uniref:Lipase n=1 Tax=Plectus sambesii TaxID=2011161 RepID=A0A914UKQ4_9BILA